MLKWVTLKRLSELTGYSVKALEKKIERGVWAEGIHFIKDPDGRIQVNTEAYETWVEGRNTLALSSTGTKSGSFSNSRASVNG